jgi:hypothetical protein
MDPTSLVNGVDDDVVRLAQVTNASVDALHANAFVSEGNHRFRYRNQVLTRHCLKRDRVRVCPACLAEDIENGDHNLRPGIRLYRRGTWIVDAIRTCPDHNVATVELGRSSVAIGTHDTQQILVDAIPSLEATFAGAQKRHPSQLEEYALSQLEGRKGPAWPDALPLYAALRLSLVVGAVCLNGPSVGIDALTDDQRHDSEVQGFEIISKGESEIRKFLDRLQSSFSEGKFDWGPKAMFGRLYEWLAHETADSAYEPMRDIMWRHVVETMPIGPGEEMFGRAIATRRLHSVQSAATEYSLHPKRLRKLLHQTGLIDGAYEDRSDERVTFDAIAGDHLLRDLSRTMSLKEAGIYINAPRPHERLLLEAGILKPWIGGGTGDLRKHVFRRSDLDAFLDALLADASNSLAEDPAFHDLLRAAKRACCSATEIVALILDRKLTRVGRNPESEGYLSVLVDVDEVRSHVAGTGHDGLTLREVEKELRTSTHVVKALMERGLLEAETVVNPTNRCPQQIVRPEALGRFTSAFVSLQALAAERNEHFRATSK